MRLYRGPRNPIPGRIGCPGTLVRANTGERRTQKCPWMWVMHSFSWADCDRCASKRLELAYRRFLPSVSEIPATFEYIDLEGPPDHLQITKIGGYPTGSGSEAGGWADIISHIMAPFGNGAQVMARSAIDSPINRRYLAPRAPLAGSIRPSGPPAQIDVLTNCVFRRKYYQNPTLSLLGYPRGYIPEPQQSSFSPSARPRIYPRIYPWVHSWTYPRAYRWTRCDSNCVRCGPGEITRLNPGDLRPRKPQSLHAPLAQLVFDAPSG